MTRKNFVRIARAFFDALFSNKDALNGKSPRARKLRLEGLEDRSLLSATPLSDVSGLQNALVAEETPLVAEGTLWVVNSIADSASTSGTLRYALANAQDGDVVTFASSLKGKTIALSGEPLIVNKAITIDASSLWSANSPGVTISANNASRVFNITGNAVLKGLIITGGCAENGAGVHITANASVEMDKCYVRDNKLVPTSSYDVRGGGIYNAGELTLTESVVRDNSTNFSVTGQDAVVRGLGIYSLGKLTATDSKIDSNGGSVYVTAATFDVRGWGICAEDELALYNCEVNFNNGARNYSGSPGTVESNKCYGGGICATGNVAILDGCDISDNNAGWGGGLYLDSTSASVANCVVKNNSASWGANAEYDTNVKGGGIFNKGVLSLIDSELSNNSASASSDRRSAFARGGALCSVGTASVERCSFTENSISANGSTGAEAFGGALCSMDGAVITVDDADFANNSATNYGGAVDLCDSDATISNSRFENNQATYQGGALKADRGSLKISGCEFCGNSTGEYGGAAQFYNVPNLEISNSIFAQNNANANGGAIDVCGETFRFDSLTFSENGSESVIYGGAFNIHAANGSILNSIFENNLSSFAGGAGSFQNGSSVEIDNATLVGNRCLAYGGAFDFNSWDVPNTSVVISNSRFENNSAKNGGAITTGSVQTLAITDSSFDNNLAEENAGALGTSASLTLERVSFNRNKALANGGAVRLDSPAATVRESVFYDNSAGNEGGAIKTDFGTLTIDGSKFSRNTANSNGGALQLWEMSQVIVNNSSFRWNASNGGDAGAIFLRGGTFSFDGDSFTENGRETTGVAGALMLVYASGTIQNSSFERNSAKGNSGAVQLTGSSCSFDNVVANENVAGGYAGAFDFNAEDRSGIYVNVDNSRFENNYAKSGGGAFSSGNPVTIAIANSYFKGNVTEGEGGAINANVSGGSLSVESSTFVENSANTGGAIGFLNNTDATIADSVFSNNVATNYGGAISSTGTGATVTLENALISGNQADYYGGGLYLRGTSTITGATVVDNTAKSYFGGGLAAFGVTEIRNSIIDSNSAPNYASYNEIYKTAAVNANNVLSSCVDWTNASNSGVVNYVLDSSKPLFIDKAGGDYRLAQNSQAIGKGKNAYVSTDADLRGAQRIADSIVDLGAYEFDRRVYDLVVTTTEDSATTQGSLRYALAHAQDGDTITFHSSLKGATIVLDGTQLQITKSITIDASNLWDETNDSPGLAIDGNDLSRVFYVQAKTSFIGLTIANGRADDGAGAYLLSDANFEKCAFVSCCADGRFDDIDVSIYSRGGGVCVSSSSTATFSQCDFRDNLAVLGGGASVEGIATFEGCSFTGNQAISIVSEAGNAYKPGGGGAIRVCNGNATVVDCDISHNEAGSWGGGVYVQIGSTGYFERCRISYNASNRDPYKTFGGLLGGGIAVTGGTSCFVNCEILRNETNNSGGGCALYWDGVALFKNCLIAENTSPKGGGVYSYSNLTRTTAPLGDFTNCAITNNNAFSSGGGALQEVTGELAFYNSIIVDNDAPTNPDVGGSVVAHKSLSSFDSWANASTSWVVNYRYDASLPLFADANGGDYRLAENSQAIDKGNNDYVEVDTDLRGAQRIGNGVVDLGAYEYDPSIARLLVTTTEDSATTQGSLRYALANAQDGETITFHSSLKGATITLGGTELSVNKLITIDASNLWDATTDAPGIAISGNGASRVFNVSKKASLIGLTITGGNGYSGGGIYANKDLFLKDCVVANNAATNYGGGLYLYYANGELVNCSVSDNTARYNGGGCYVYYGSLKTTDCAVVGNISTTDYYNGGGYYLNYSDAELTRSRFSGNSSYYGGAIYSSGNLVATACEFVDNSSGYFGGALYSSGDLVATACEFVGNSARYYGGAIYLSYSPNFDFVNCSFVGNVASNNGGAVYVSTFNEGTFANCTIAGNYARNYGGGVYSGSFSPLFQNSIVALNRSGLQGSDDLYGKMDPSSSHNLIGIDPGFVVAPVFETNGNLTNADSVDIRLASNSLAIDRGDNSVPSGACDLDGNPRKQKSWESTATVDIGAYEYQFAVEKTPEPKSLVVSTDLDVVDETDGLTSLREAILFADSGETITFAPALKGKTITLNGSSLVVDKALSIDASSIWDDQAGKPGITISANAASRVFTIFAETSLTALDIADGSSFNGGNVLASATLNVSRSLIRGGTASYGGGVYLYAGTLSFENSLIYGNGASFYGGGVYGTGVFRNCAISGNAASSRSGGVYSSGTSTFYNTIVALNRAKYESEVGGLGYFDLGSLIGIDPDFVVPPTFDSNGKPNNVSSVDFHLARTSLAIDRGVNDKVLSSIDFDGTQRIARSWISSPTVDCGPYEYQETFVKNPEAPSVVVTTAEDLVDEFDGQISLREALAYANQGDTITFAPDLQGATIALTGVDLYAGIPVTIDGTDRDITISGSNKSRVFTVQADSTIIGLTIAEGDADSGGGISSRASLTLKNCSIVGNSAQSYGGGIVSYDGTSLTLDGCAIKENLAYDGGGGVYCYFGTRSFVNCEITGNNGAYGGGAYFESGTSTFVNCSVSGNSVSSSGYGAGLYCSSGTRSFVDCEITGNTGAYYGGGAYCYYGSDSYVNCTIADNSAYYGGGVYCNYGTHNFDNSIIASNTATQSGADVYRSSNNGAVNARNVLSSFDAWSNASTSGVVNYLYDPAKPLFADATEGYRLATDSQALDKGDNSLISAEYDIVGNPRVYNGIVDLGAYEYLPRLAAPTLSATPAKTAITVKINAVENATRYVLEYGTDPNYENCETLNVLASGELVLEGLSPETTYYLRVKATDGETESDWSQLTATTARASIAAPTLALSQITDTSFVATIGPVAGANRYVLEYATNPVFQGYQLIYCDDPGDKTISGLTIDATYYVRVKSSAEGFYDSDWTTASAKTDLGSLAAPGVSNVAVKGTTITAKLAASTNARQYLVEYGTDETFATVETATYTAAGTMTFSSLQSGSAYYFRVKAVADHYYDSDWTTFQAQTAPRDADLCVTSVTAPATAVSGSLIELVWNEKNAGPRTVSEVRRDAIYISTDGTLENAELIKTVRYTDALAPNESVRRRQTITVPSIGYVGNVKFVVVADYDDTILESDETNNSRATSTATTLKQTLSVSLSASSVDEGTQNVRGTVSRTGDLSEPLVVSIVSNDATELTVAESVTIPAGQASAPFHYSAIKDDEYDSDVYVELVFSAAGFETKYATVKVVNIDHPQLSLSVSKYSLDEGEEFILTVTRSYVTDKPITVRLTASSSSQLNLPSSVVIPANESAVAVTVSVVDDDRPESVEEVRIAATSPTFTSASKTVSILDDDEPTIAISLDVDAVGEGVGGGAFVGTVTRTESASSALRVRLTSSDTAKIGVPNEVTIPAGRTSVKFYGASYDNGIVDGDVLVTITATGVQENCGCSMSSDSTGTAATQILVADDDGAALTVRLSKALLSQGEENASTVTVSRNTAATDDLVVSLVSSDPILIVPETITIPAGSASATAAIATGLGESFAMEIWTTITATAPGFSQGTAKALVSDALWPDLRPSNVQSIQSETDLSSFEVSYYVVNEGRAETRSSWKEQVWVSTKPTLDDDAQLVATFERNDAISNADGNNSVYRSFSCSPLDMGDSVYWIVVVDSDETITELCETNNLATSGEQNYVPPYAAVVQTDVEKADPSTPIPLYGYAYDVNTGARVGGVDVTIDISNGSVLRTLTVTTASDGSFETTWIPLSTEVGSYTVGARRPGKTTAPVQDCFSLMKLSLDATKATINISDGQTVTGSFVVRNKTSEPITNLAALVEGLADNIRLDVKTSSTVVPAGGSATVTLTATALSADLPVSAAKLRVTSEETGDEEIDLAFNVYPSYAVLTTDKPILSTSMTVGAQKIVEFEICNESGVETGPITVDLPSDFAWLSCVNGTTLDSLAPGEARTVQLLLNPSADMPLQMYQGRFVLHYGNTGLGLDFKFRAKSEVYSDLTVRAVDEWTYYTDDGPAVSGASVKVVDALTKQVVSVGTTGDDGLWSVVGLAEGYYDIYVDAEKHNNYHETIYLDDDQNLDAFLQMQTVRYEWTVTPTTIEDEYDVSIETIFETNVPAPVITVSPALVDVSDMEVGEIRQIDFTIENHGLIAVYDFAPLYGPETDYGEFVVTPLVDGLDVLSANSSVVIPVIFERRDPATVDSNEEFVEAPVVADQTTANARGVAMNRMVFERRNGNASQTSSLNSTTTVNDDRLSPLVTSGGSSCSFLLGYAGHYECSGDRLVETSVSCLIDPNCFRSGWDGGSGGVSFSGGSGANNYWLSPASSSTSVSVTTNSPCEEKNCLPAYLNTAICAIGMIPLPGTLIAGCIGGLISTFITGGDFIDWVLSVGGCVPSPLKYSSALCAATLVKGLYDCKGWGPNNLPKWPDWQDELDELGQETTSTRSTSGEASSSSSYLRTLVDSLCDCVVEFLMSQRWIIDIYGDRQLFEMDWAADYVLYKALVNAVGPDKKIDANARAQILMSAIPESATTGQVEAFIDRWNRTVDYAGRGILTSNDVPTGESLNFIDWEIVKSDAERALALENAASDAGHDDLWGALVDANAALREYLELVYGSEGTCASVKLQLKQSAVLTRDAFDAQLVLENSTADVLTNVTVDIIVYDEWRNDVTSQFGIYDPTTQNFSGGENGELGSLAGNASGQANWIFIPSTECAKNGAQQYSVGGILHYTIDGREIAVAMAPATITVYPQPELEVNYFWQRNVIGDDPWTDEIEPSEPFELAVMVQNKGAGDAQNLRIISAQPEIVENEKGLLIDFTIVGSQLNGREASNSLTVDFGTVPAGGAAVGQWFMESTLQGHFIDYSATFQHVNGFNDLQFSLIKNVTIHELVHSVKDDSDGADDLPDFLVNDNEAVIEVYDLPDTLYLSSGEVESVATTTNYSISGSIGWNSLTVDLTVGAADSGWNYVWIHDQDPGASDYELYRVVRSDGKELNPANFWQTHRTFIDGVDVKNENTLHILDKFESASDVYTYTLFYRPADQTGPRIASIEQLQSNIRVAPLETVDVEFSEPIAESTFTTANLSLTRNGGRNLIDNLVSIQKISDKIYRIAGLSSATGADGEYKLTVSTLGITDVWGNLAETDSTSLEWINASESPIVVSIDQPAEYGQDSVGSLAIVFSLPVDASTFGLEDLTLTRDSGENLLTSDSGAALNARSATEFVLSGLTNLTSEDGKYVFSVKATGVRGTDAKRGVGVWTIEWTKDVVGPSSAVWSGVDRAAVNYGYDALYLGFDEEIDFATLSRADLTLTRNGLNVPLDARLAMGILPESLKSTDAVQEWKLVGLRNFAAEDGDYVLTVDLSNVADLAGNLGSGRFSVSWTVDSEAPTLAFSQGINTSSSEIELAGLASEENVVVRIYDASDSSELFAGSYAGRDVAINLALPREGARNLRVRVTDAAGNWSDSELTARIDRTAPFVLGTSIEENVLSIRFSEPTNLAELIAGGSIVRAVSVVDDVAGTALDLPAAKFVYDPATKTLTIDLNSIEVAGRETIPLTLRIDGSLVLDAAGNALKGSAASAGTPIRFALSGTVATANSYSVPSLVDWNGDGKLDLLVGEKSADGLGRVQVRLNDGSNASPNYADPFYATYRDGTATVELTVPGQGCQGAAPRAVDVDGDGALDLFVGLADGTILFYRGRETGANWTLTAPEFVTYGLDGAKSQLSVGNRAVFEVCDWNGDGRFDLLVGAGDGKLYVLVDSASEGLFDFRNALALTSADGTGELVLSAGRAAPTLADVNGDGKLDIVAGDSNGAFWTLLNVGTPANPRFESAVRLTDVDGDLALPNSAKRSRPFATDYDGDGVADLLVGSSDGSVYLYRGLKSSSFNTDGEPGGAFVCSVDWIFNANVVSEQLATPNMVKSLAKPTSITVKIGTVANATGYVVQYGTDPEFATYETATTDPGYFTASGLQSSTTYYFRVKATASGYKDSDWKELSVTTDKGTLKAPEFAVDTTNTAIVVKIFPSDGADRYVLEYSTDPSFESGVVHKEYTAAQIGSSKTFSKLTTLTTYYVRVKATGENFYDSAWTTASPIPGAPRVAAPTLSASATKTAVIVNIKAVDGAATYELQYSQDPDFTGATVKTYKTGGAKTFTNLPFGVTYYFRVKASGDGYNDSKWSTIEFAAGELSATTVKTSNVNYGSLDVAISSVANARSYEIQYATDQNFTDPTTLTYSTYGTKSLSGLDPETTYYFRAKATGDGVNRVDSKWSVVKTATTKAYLGQLAVSAFTATATKSAIVVKLETPVENAAKYVVEFGTDPTFATYSTRSYPSVGLKTISGLQTGATYYVRVKTTAPGYADSDYAATVKLIPGGATLATPAVALAQAANTSLDLEIAEVANATSYVVEYGTDETFATCQTATFASAGVQTISGLTYGQTYFVRVKATSLAANDSKWSATLEARTTGIDAPTASVSTTKTAVVVKIGTVANASSYVVEYGTDPSYVGAGVKTYPTTGIKTISGLESGTTYYLRVKAVSTELGESDWVELVTETKPDVHPLAAPEITSVSTTKTAVTFRLNPVENATTYVVEYGTDPSFVGAVTKTYATTGAKTISGLISGTTYYFRAKVLAEGFADSAWTTFDASTLLPPLDPPQVSATPQTTSVVLNIKTVSGANAYVVEFGTDPSFGNVATKTYPSSGVKTIAGLQSGTSYWFRIKATAIDRSDSEWFVFSATTKAPTSSKIALEEGFDNPFDELEEFWDVLARAVSKR